MTDESVLARLDPQLRAAALAWERCDLTDIATARATDAAMVAGVNASDIPGLRANRVRTRDLLMPVDDERGHVPLRVYEPANPQNDRGALLFVHGGGYCLGDLETDHLRCTLYAQEAGVVIVSVDYALAPERPYPAGFEDCVSALAWLREHHRALGVDPSRIGVGGESAGAGLATAVALHDRGQERGDLRCQMLLFPALDHECATNSIATGHNLPAWNSTQTQLMWTLYLSGAHEPDEYASPGNCSDLSGMPPTLIMTAELDPLRDEGLMYAQRLLNQDAHVEIRNFPGTFHVFDLAVPTAAVSQRALRDQIGYLRRHLALRT